MSPVRLPPYLTLNPRLWLVTCMSDWFLPLPIPSQNPRGEMHVVQAHRELHIGGFEFKVFLGL